MNSPVRTPDVRDLRVGCAGWSIPTRHKALFGEGDSHLARYATRFDTTEINSTFHRAHALQTFERWAASVPARFRFSVKMPKRITHEARLQMVGEALTTFFEAIGGLGPKLGGVLVQLPPSLAFDARVANRFFSMVRRRSGAPIACEPRHPSWFTPEVEPLWTRYAITRVAADPARWAEAAIPGGSAGAHWRYWRWHGSPTIYYSRYDDSALDALAAAIRTYSTAPAQGWCIFDNTAQGHATTDALRLLQRLKRQRSPDE